ncbi:MAG: response regulator [Acidobacteria bacterium]|nr:response regulator [Acidobacteriota bacterium]
MTGLVLMCAAGAAGPSGPDPHKSIAQLRSQRWRPEQGVPHRNVLAVVHSRDGYVWLGTELGLARFDGLRFTPFDRSNTQELGSNLVYAVLEDRSGQIWIGTAGGGLTVRSGGKFHTYTTKDGLANNVVLSLYQDRAGTLWIGTAGGLSMFRNGRFHNYSTSDGLAGDPIYAVTQSDNGVLWAGGRGGLSRLEGARFRAFTTADGLPNSYVRSLAWDRDGALWIGTNGGGLARFQNEKFTVLTTRNGLTSDAVVSLLEDSAGSLWIGTLGGGVNRLANGKIDTYTTADGLVGNDVWDLRQDEDGAIWIGATGGLERLNDGVITSYGVREGLSHDVALPLFQDRDGAIWIGTQRGGLNRFFDGKFTVFGVKDGLPGPFVMSLGGGVDGSLWVGTRDGLGLLQHGKWRRYTTEQGLPSNSILAIHVDRRGVVWIGGGTGLSRFEDGRFFTYGAKDGLPDGPVKALEEGRNGDLWVGTASGVARLHNGRFTVWNTKNGLSGDAVVSLHEDAEGAMWIGSTGAGLNRLKDGKLRAILARDGLPDDSVFRMLEDGLGNLWFSCNHGIFRASLRALNDFADGRRRSVEAVLYGAADGMRDAECNGAFHPAGIRTRDGRLWFPTMRGVVAIDPRRAISARPAPPVTIEQVLVDRHSVDPRRPFAAPPGSGELEFRYASLGFDRPERITFRYQLEGFDRDWVDAGARRAAYYTNIAPGTYRFRVIGSNGDGVWSTSASYRFELRPHFYEARWFYALCMLVALGAAGGVYLLNERRIRAKERIMAQMMALNEGMRGEIAERQRVEHDLVHARDAAEQASRLKSQFLANVSHEIRTPMNAILGMTGLVLETRLEREQREHLEVTRDSASELLHTLDDILTLSTLETGGAKLENIDFDLRALLEEAERQARKSAEAKGLAFSSRLAPETPRMFRGDPAYLRQILEKLLENAVKFTLKGSISLSAEWTPPTDGAQRGILHFAVCDTGIGIPASKLGVIFSPFAQADGSATRKFGGAGLGLAICGRLATLMGGELTVKSEVGVGSDFHLSVRLAPSAKREAAPAKPTALPPAANRRRILVAEDNPVNQRLLVRLLENRGHVVTVAANGVQALAAIEQGGFDIVLMDLQMPEMGGLEATEEIRRRETDGSHTPIVAVTANSMNGERELCYRAGMDGFLTKPVQPGVLFETVEKSDLLKLAEHVGPGDPVTETSDAPVTSDRR